MRYVLPEHSRVTGRRPRSVKRAGRWGNSLVWEPRSVSESHRSAPFRGRNRSAVWGPHEPPRGNGQLPNANQIFGLTSWGTGFRANVHPGGVWIVNEPASSAIQASSGGGSVRHSGEDQTGELGLCGRVGRGARLGCTEVDADLDVLPRHPSPDVVLGCVRPGLGLPLPVHACVGEPKRQPPIGEVAEVWGRGADARRKREDGDDHDTVPWKRAQRGGHGRLGEPVRGDRRLILPGDGDVRGQGHRKAARPRRHHSAGANAPTFGLGERRRFAALPGHAGVCRGGGGVGRAGRGGSPEKPQRSPDHDDDGHDGCDAAASPPSRRLEHGFGVQGFHQVQVCRKTPGPRRGGSRHRPVGGPAYTAPRWPC